MYVILGATGNVGSKIATMLLEAGKLIRVISRSSDKLRPLIIKGAVPFTGNIGDTDFLVRAFTNAEAVFSMIPPNNQALNQRSYQNEMSESIAAALKKAGVTRVVNLSSIGAQLRGKTGPIAGLHDHEERLNKIRGLNVIHLRAGYFMENSTRNFEVNAERGFISSALRGDLPIPVIATKDIAGIAADYLIGRRFSGKSARHLLGERNLTMREMTSILGMAVGDITLGYVKFSYDQMERVLKRMGMSPDVARSYVEMEQAFNKGMITRGLARTPERTTDTTFEDFAEEFARIYCLNNPACMASGF